jgi:putative ABC transport system permease protein
MHKWREIVCQRLSESGIDLPGDSSLVEELAHHLEDRFIEQQNRGASDERAFEMALKELENYDDLVSDLSRNHRPALRAPLLGEEGKRSARSTPLAVILHDMRHAVRVLRMHPWISLVAIVTLALGIGVNGVIFSATYGLLLRPLPYGNIDRLVVLGSEDHINQREIQTSFPDFLDWKTRTRTLERLAAVLGAPFNIGEGGRTERFEGSLVSADFFPSLGIQAEAGRTFSAEDHTRGSDPVVVISHALWRWLFGLSPDAVGRSILLDGRSFTIVGVMPETFQYPRRQALWVPLEPLAQRQTLVDRSIRNATAVGVMRRGTTVDQVRNEFREISVALETEFPATNQGIAATVTSLNEVLVGRYRTRLLILQWAVGLVLLIACANVANLLLAQTASRQREFGIRVAIGASRSRLIAQLLTESLVLSFMAAFAGLICAWWTVLYLQYRLADSLSRLGFAGIHINVPVMAAMAVAAALTTVLVGLTPALASSQPSLDRLLRAGGGSGSSLRQRRMQSFLVISEIALATMLLVASGLMVRSFMNLTSADPGLRVDNILTMRVALSPVDYPTAERTMAFFKAVEQGVRGMAGVESFAAVGYLPFIGYNPGTDFRIQGQPPSDRPFRADIQPMTPDYFKVVQMAMLRGRPLLEADWKPQAEVAVINQAFSRRFFGEADPLGATLVLPDSARADQRVTIVGIVNDVHQFGMFSDPRPEIYIPVTRRIMYLAIRTTGRPGLMANAVRHVLEQIDPNQPVFAISSFAGVMSRSYAAPQALGLLLSGLGSVALAMVAIAIYGMISYSVTQRSHEIGVRIALGATRNQVVRLVLRSGMRMAVWGVVVGALGAAGLSRGLRRYVYGVTSVDPVTYVGVALLMCALGLAACYFPARCAARVDPIATLREE